MIEAPTTHYHRPLTHYRALVILSWVWLCALLGGCAYLPQQSPENPIPQVLSPQQQDALLTLEYAALDALQRQHFSAPKETSAEALYNQMLAIDPNNAAAQRGLERVLEHHVETALEAINAQQITSAKRALAQARRLDPGHPSIAPAENQLNLLANAEFARIDLPIGDVRQQPRDISRQLDDLMSQIQADQNCRFTIAVASDEQGRYVYQLLKHSISEYAANSRPRAAIVISSPNRVESTCY
jgi:hypothetical protein